MRALSKWAGIVVAAVALGAATAQEKRPPAAVAKPRAPAPAATAAGRPAATTPPSWKDVDRLVSEQKFGESLVQLHYIQRFEKHPLIWKFMLYKPSNTWLVNGVMFNDQMLF